jgi:Sec-independent protein translocase protein TatA
MNTYFTKEVVMAHKGGLKRFFFLLVLVALLAVVFVLLGGGNLLKSTGTWLGGVGKKAEDVKQTIEQKATSAEKTMEKLKDEIKPGDKK